MMEWKQRSKRGQSSCRGTNCLSLNRTVSMMRTNIDCRGTIHAWKNVSNEICRMLFVLVPAEKVKNESTGEYLEITPTPKLLNDDTK